jgi:hypothetical protein
MSQPVITPDVNTTYDWRLSPKNRSSCGTGVSSVQPPEVSDISTIASVMHDATGHADKPNAPVTFAVSKLNVTDPVMFKPNAAGLAL